MNHAVKEDTLKYLVSWRGQPNEGNSWIPEEELVATSAELLIDYKLNKMRVRRLVKAAYTDVQGEDPSIIYILVNWVMAQAMDHWVDARDLINTDHANNAQRLLSNLPRRENHIEDAENSRTEEDAISFVENLANITLPRALKELSESTASLFNTEDPDELQQLLGPALATIHLDSRKILSLPIIKKWPRAWKRAWEEACDQYADYLNQHLDNYEAGTSNTHKITMAVIGLLCLPAYVLAPITKRRLRTNHVHMKQKNGRTVILEPIPTDLEEKEEEKMLHDNNHVLRAVTEMRKGRKKKARQLLSSNGSVERDLEAYERLKAMHPAPKTKITQPVPKGQQIKLTTSQCSETLKRKAGNMDSPFGTYAWNAEQFNGQRSKQRKNGKPTLLTTVARLEAMMANVDIPITVSYAMATNHLSELNKVNKEEQARRAEAGEGKATRPVAGGTEFLKGTMITIMQTRDAEKARKKVAPLNTACGMKNGSSTMARTAQAAYKKNLAILQNDFQNAYNTIERNTVLSGTAKHFPTVTNFINSVYGIPTMIFYTYYDEVLHEHTIQVIESQNGVKQGCVFAQLLFCLAIKDPMEKIQRDHSEVATLIAQSDDINTIIHRPADDNWSNRWEKVADMMDEYDHQFKPIGLYRHPNKMKLILPPGIPAPEDDRLQNCEIQTGGKTSGIHYGSDQFVMDSSTEKAQKIAEKIIAITKIAEAHPHMAMVLVSNMLIPLIYYYFSHTPPNLCEEAFKIIDKAMWTAREDIFNPKCMTLPPCSAERLKRAHSLLSLSTLMGGAGHYPSKMIAVAAYLTRMRDLRQSQGKIIEKSIFQNEVQIAVDMALKQIGFPLHIDQFDKQIMPANANDVLHITNPLSNFNNKSRAFGKMLELMNWHSALNFSKEIVEPSPEEHLSKADATHLMSIMVRSLVPRIFSIEIWNSFTEIKKMDFIRYLRFYLNLQKLRTNSGNLELNAQINEMVEVCQKCNAQMTPDASHEATCSKWQGKRIALHNRIRNLITGHAKSMGINATSEPPTSEVLLNEFTEKWCRNSFPKKRTGEAAVRASQLKELNAKIIDPNTARNEYAAAKSKIQSILSSAPDDGAGLRLDNKLDAADVNLGEEKPVWIDVKGTLTNQASKQEESFTFFSNIHRALPEGKPKV